MKINLTGLVRDSRHRAAFRGFTLVELSLCIAVVAVAMVAIVGVLPAGINVQKENREETIVNSDASLLLEAIRTGTVSARQLTNYFDLIRIDTTGSRIQESSVYVGTRYPLSVSMPDYRPSAQEEVFEGKNGLSSATNIIGLLSIPRVIENLDPLKQLTNRITAVVRAFSGALSDKPTLNAVGNPPVGTLDTAFRYRVTAEVSAHVAYPTNQALVSDENLRQFEQLHANLYDVTLTFEWPIFVVKNEIRVGKSRSVYRTQVASRLQPNPLLRGANWPLNPWFFQTDRLAATQP